MVIIINRSAEEVRWTRLSSRSGEKNVPRSDVAAWVICAQDRVRLFHSGDGRSASRVLALGNQKETVYFLPSQNYTRSSGGVIRMRHQAPSCLSFFPILRFLPFSSARRTTAEA